MSGATLVTAELEVEGVLTDASNLTARVLLTDAAGEPTGERALYKPIRGEAPLRDFPARTLGRREVAAFLVSSVGDWDLIPQTVLRDGPLGPGSVQRWIDWESTGRGPGAGLLEVFPDGAVPDGWLPVVQGEAADGSPVTVGHADTTDLASLAVLDVVLNNADRKAAHLTVDVHGRLRGFDHGLTLHADDKLRTVLWGWAGQALDGPDRTNLEQLVAALDEGTGVEALLTEDEVRALRARAVGLLTAGHLPPPPVTRYPLPWPLW